MNLLRNVLLCSAALVSVACGDDVKTKVDWQVVAKAKSNSEYPGIYAAKVCVDAHPDIPCAVTDPDGFFTMSDLPANTALVLTIEKSGFIPGLRPIQTTDTDASVFQPIVMIEPSDLPTDLSYAVDNDALGVVTFSVFTFLDQGDANPGVLPGVKVSLNPQVENSPVYYSAPDVFDPTLDATASYSGTFGLGNLASGDFFNVPPGDYTMTFTPPAGYACYALTSPIAAWGIPDANQPASLHLPVRAGYHTGTISLHCQR